MACLPSDTLPSALLSPALIGAVDGTRTCDLRFTKALLYQLSYDGFIGYPAMCADCGAFFNTKPSES